MNRSDAAVDFDALYQEQDPFGYRSRWYEARKRDILMATLPHPRFAHAWELGCSNGETTRVLAGRCETLLATDVSAQAVALARQRVVDLSNVRVMQACHPQQWPEGSFDLVVLSEVGYYLPIEALAEVVVRIQGTLAPDGLLVACHWRHPFQGARQHGEQVHAQIHTLLTLPCAYRYQDSDFLLEAWTADSQSVAQREGLR